MPYLPVLVRVDEDQVFSFDPDPDRRALNDFNDLLSQLYIDHHITPLQEWAHELGMNYRIQPYGLQTDAVAKAAIVDTAEGESLGFNNLDDFRSLRPDVYGDASRQDYGLLGPVRLVPYGQAEL